jgi:hypothetical protein
VPGYERSRVVLAAQTIVDQGGWCVFEVCLDVPGQRSEARALIFDLLAEAVADTVEEEIEHEPEYDARLTGCDRRTLAPDVAFGAYLCYLTETPEAAAPSPVTKRSLPAGSAAGCEPAIPVGSDKS